MDLIKFPKTYEKSNKTPSPLMSRKEVMKHFGIGSTTLHNVQSKLPIFIFLKFDNLLDRSIEP